MVNRVQPSHPFIEFKKEEIEQTVTDRFEQQVKQHSARLAVKGKDRHFTYETLNRTANRIAHAILAQRGQGEEPIGLLFEPGALAVAAILGTLKAGKIWVPLDPALPQARLAYILADAQIKLILTNEQYVALAQESDQATPLLNLDRLEANLPETNPGLAISPEAIAYILYTSGSTGQPKGVIQKHRNILHAIHLHTNSLQIGPDDQLSQLASLSHLSGGTAIFRAILNGAAVSPYYLRSEGIDRLAGWLMQEEITIYQSVPTVFRHLVNSFSGAETFPKLRLIHLGGEAVSKGDVERYKKYFAPTCILLHNLGSTEVYTYRQYFMNKEIHISGNLVPVGYAVEDKEILLLDEAGQPVGFDAVGEIVVKSRYLSPGYWRRPDLTQAAFSSVPGEEELRLYRTGDLGLMQPDGCLIHIGRKDAQVKIRGQRVELGEIEMILLEHINIKDAAVVVYPRSQTEFLPHSRSQTDPSASLRTGFGNEDNYLVAYLAPRQEPRPAISELRDFLRRRLPDYMVPAAFMFLAELPLLPNGKINRRALPSPPLSQQGERGPGGEGPQTPIEQYLADIWAELLKLERVSIHHNFFELGGHSLHAMQILIRLRDMFGVELTLRDFFEVPTIAELAQTIEHLKSKVEERVRFASEAEQVSRLKPASRQLYRLKRGE
jgi:amino acid adenylation domain-containing protein